MSDLTALIAISFLGLATAFLIIHVYNLANRLAVEMVAGATGDAPMPTWFRTRMLFNMWLPYQFLAFIVEAILFIAFWEAAELLSHSGAKIVPYLLAFVTASGAVFALMTMTFGLFQYIRGLRQTE
jgi:small-conductance mechanosensitive channel